MKITDRINKLSGVEKSFWNGESQELTIYYDETIPPINVQVRVSKQLADVQLQDSVRNIKFLSIKKGTFNT